MFTRTAGVAGSDGENRSRHADPDARGRAIGQFPIDEFAKRCLLEGVDELGYMLQQDPAIRAFEAKRVGSIHTLQ